MLWEYSFAFPGTIVLHYYTYTKYPGDAFLATNTSCCYSFFDKAQELNPDFTWLDNVKGL